MCRRESVVRSAKATLLVVLALLAISLSACGRSGDEEQPSVERVGAAQAPASTITFDATATPAEVEFRSSLEAAALAKYDALPAEFQGALAEEAATTDRDIAVQHLRDLPSETLPIATIVSSGVLARFEDLDPPLQRALLLDAYVDAFRVYADELGEGSIEAEAPAALFEQAVELTYGGGATYLPALEDTLSQEAFARLDALDPHMQRAFRTAWRFRKAALHEVDDTVAQMERGLMAAPAQMPPLDSLGLTENSVALLEMLPEDIRDWLWQIAAADLVSGVDPGESELLRDEFVVSVSTPAAVDAFDRDLMPATADPLSSPVPIVCAMGPQRWPPGTAVSQPERLMDRYAVFLPPPDAALSPGAAARLRAMDAQLRRVVDQRWKELGPVTPERRACEVAKWDRDLLGAPLTEVPSLVDLLTEESVQRYAGTPRFRQEAFQELLALQIIEGRTRSIGEVPAVLFDKEVDGFVEALRAWAEEWVDVNAGAG